MSLARYRPIMLCKSLFLSLGIALSRKRWLARSLIALILFIGPAGQSFADNCFSYEPTRVKVTGKLSLGRGYGPPNFGEDPAHDELDIYGLITLDQPVCVSGGKDDLDEYVDRINVFQLVPNNGQKLDRQLVGHRIVVTGRLFHRISGGHTDVLVLYDEVHRAP